MLQNSDGHIGLSRKTFVARLMLQCKQLSPKSRVRSCSKPPIQAAELRDKGALCPFKLVDDVIRQPPPARHRPLFALTHQTSAFPETSILTYGIVPQSDTYTHLREGSHTPSTIRVELADARSSWLHINPYTGEVISVIDRSRRVYRTV